MFLNQSLLNKFNWQKWTLWLLFVLAFAWPRLIVVRTDITTDDLIQIFSCAFCLTSPFFFLKPKWRWILILMVWVIAIFEFVNYIYFKFFWDYIPISALFLFDNYDPTTFNAALNGFKVQHLIIFLYPIVFTAAWFFGLNNLNKKIHFNKISIFIFSILSLTPCIYSEGKVLIEENKDSHSFAKTIDLRYFNNWGYNNFVSYYSGGSVQYIARGLFLLIYNELRSRELTDLQTSDINHYWELHNNSSNSEGVEDIFASNKDKNLIFIIIESLNAEAVLLEINGHQLMPNLYNLLKDKNTISALNVVSQIKSGVSSDGQLLLTTGLYPYSASATMQSFAKNDFPALPKLLNRNSLEIICEYGSLWKHSETNKSYGYNSLIENVKKRAKTESITQDYALYRTALDVVDTIPHPFLMTLSTMDMHSPWYNELVPVPQWIKEIGVEEDVVNYYNMCNVADSAIGEFINKLKEKNIYDNTIIVLASDHALTIGKKAQEQPIVFMALNTGMHREVKEAIGQVDIFPTILDIMGRHDAPWRGMGYSIFDHPTERVDGPPGQLKPEVQELVNLMHFGNWYGNWAK